MKDNFLKLGILGGCDVPFDTKYHTINVDFAVILKSARDSPGIGILFKSNFCGNYNI
jgi:hypothetical protein